MTRLCQYGWPGVWGPKITKVGALYRPDSVPVLDGYVALAFGFREGFSEGKQPRWSRIERVVHALAEAVNANADLLNQLRADAHELVPDLNRISDLRLLDIIIWTSQDDRISRVRKNANRWLNADLRDRTPIKLEDVTPVSVICGDSYA